MIEIADAIVEANLGAAMSPGQRFTNPAYIDQGWALQVPAGQVIPTVKPTAVKPTADQPTADVSPPPITPPSTSRPLMRCSRATRCGTSPTTKLGEPTDWPGIWERNRGRDMGGGRTLDDPNLILPGWDLEIDDVVDDTYPPEPTTPDELNGHPECPEGPDMPAVATPMTTPPAALPTSIPRRQPPRRRPPPLHPTTARPSPHDHRGAVEE